MDWFNWIPDEKLRAAADLVANGGMLDRQQANETLDLLDKVSVQTIKTRLGQAFYSNYFPTNRKGGNWKAKRPFGLVDHYTAGIYMNGVLRWFSSEPRVTSGSSSAHYVMDRDGTLVQLIDPRRYIAWHARRTSYTHIGIEHVNTGFLRKSASGTRYLYQERHNYPTSRNKLVQNINGTYWEPYTSHQIAMNIVLKRWLVWAIPTLKKEHFVDHEAVDPGRKKDCGPLWPLKSINALVFSEKAFRDLESLKEMDILEDGVEKFNDEVDSLLG